MKTALYLLSVVIVISLISSTNIFAEHFSDDYLGTASSGLVFIPGKGYSWPPMGGPASRYYYDASGRSHLVEVVPFALEVKRSPVEQT